VARVWPILGRASRCQGANLTQFRFQRQSCPAHIVRRLEVRPELLARAEKTRQAYGRIRRDPAALQDDVVDARGRNPELLGQGIGREVQRLQELLTKNLAGVDRPGRAATCPDPPLLNPGGSRRFGPYRHFLPAKRNRLEIDRLSECCAAPVRSPCSASNRLPGGMRKSASEAALSSIQSFRMATRRKFGGSRRGFPPAHSLSMSRPPELWITGSRYNGIR